MVAVGGGTLKTLSISDKIADAEGVALGEALGAAEELRRAHAPEGLRGHLRDGCGMPPWSGAGICVRFFGFQLVERRVVYFQNLVHDHRQFQSRAADARIFLSGDQP